MLTLDRVKEIVRYDPDTGHFFRIGRTGRKGRIGARMGAVAHGKYRRIAIDGLRVYEHRLAWIYMTGAWSTREIDHIDGDPANNSWTNLRLADRSQQCANSRTKKKIGLKGTHFYKRYGRYMAQITHNDKREFLGYFDTEEEAALAYHKRAKEVFGAYAHGYTPANHIKELS